MITKAFKATIPVMTGYLVLGIGFGIILKNAGYGVIWAFLMSLCVYAGSMQYLAVELLTSQASLLTFAITTLMVNARHLFYGISMVRKYSGTGIKKPYLIFALTDETYSLVCMDDQDLSDEERFKYYLYVSLLNHIYWVTGSVAGALIGSFLQFNAEGVDFALTALFITVFTDQWIKTRNHLPAVIGVVASVICLITVGPDNFLIPTMILIVLLLFIFKKKNEKQNN